MCVSVCERERRGEQSRTEQENVGDCCSCCRQLYFYLLFLFLLFVDLFLSGTIFIAVAQSVLCSVCLFMCGEVVSGKGIALVALSAFLSQREEAGESDTVQDIRQHASLCCCPWAGE